MNKINWNKGFLRLWLVYAILSLLFSIFWVLGNDNMTIFPEHANYDASLIEPKGGFFEGFLIVLLMAAIYALPPLLCYKAIRWILDGFAKER